MLTKKRIELISMYGPEIVIKCCREWKTHFGNGNWGRCGICREVPKITQKKWDDE